MNTLEISHWNAILDGCQLDSDEYEDNQSAVKIATTITIEFAKGFYEWARKERYEIYFGNNGPNCGKWYISYTKPDRQYFTTDELITTYINTIK